MNKIKTSGLNPTSTITIATTKSFNSLINRLSSQSSHHEVLSTFSAMLDTKTPPDTFTFPGLLKACASLELFSLGLSIHQQVIVNGFSSDSYISSSLVNFYAKFGRSRDAWKMFDEMPYRDVVHWTAMIGCHSRERDIDMAFSMFNEMRCYGVKPSSVTFLEMLLGVSEIIQLQCLHGCSVFYGFLSDIALVNCMLSVYCLCGRVEDAKELFDQMGQRDLVSWNSLISGYVQIGDVSEILQLLCRMREMGMKPDKQTFECTVSANGIMGDPEIGKIVHGQIVRAGFNINMHLKTSLLTMYLKCQDVEAAFQIFRSDPDKDVVCWTAMISGLLHNGCADKALTVFSEMLKSGSKPSTEAIACVLAACAQLGSFDLGASVHGYVMRQGLILDTPVLNSLITMYAKCGHLDQSRVVFEIMEKRDLVSWNAIISGYAQKGHLCMALLLFNEMKTKTFQRSDSLTIVSLLRACASIGALHEGKLIHNFVIRSCIRPCILVDTALVDMYAKCGYLETAKKSFDLILHKDLVSWSTIISAHGFHGKGETALRIYSEFLSLGNEPNCVIFLSLLSACSHNGLVEQGLSIFRSMFRDFGVEPKHEHLACVIDLLCRAKGVNEAYEFYKENFPQASIDVLSMILDACRGNGNTELVVSILRDIIKLRPVNPGNYVQLAHCFASINRWNCMGEVWKQMRSLGLKKLPGWSFIEISGKITTFFMDHNSHPRFEEMMSVLKVLGREMRKVGNQFQGNQIHDV